ncbi:EamA family transporter [Limibaculum sp. M0105]|uniref:EamA family transporter n=1 Tax=Thermohalobaculum xanthum TaxID=2753746 RepID=A0A8J7M4S9_9RHOB|nr:EamA family transporter [Thermohalobaculum xanthum]MBK0398344.1 EamA family transporter [Thermohalobaculum xanthum]
MSASALALVLAAAFMHATWNALVKGATDRAAVLTGVSLANVIVGAALVVMAPLPAMASWPSLAVSTVVHYAYYLLLFHSYRLGDLSQVYPISRGIAPALVAVSALVLIGEDLSPGGWAGVAAVSAGIGLLAVQKGAVNAPRGSVAFALTLGVCIAVYSTADGIGVRLSESPLGYMGWLFLLEAPVPLAIAWHRQRRGGHVDRRTLLLGLFAGGLSVAAYGIVLYVKSFAPLGAVSAVRESSVVIAALMGVLLFGERPWKGRLMAAVIVAGGVMALATAS